MNIIHSEYKVPNGKLIMADICVHNSFIVDIQISGDFFLEPPIVLNIINQSLIGLSNKTNIEEIVTRINNVIPDNTVFFGLSPESIALTILKAFSYD